MIDFSQIKLEKLATHLVGNKLRNEDIRFSKDQTNIEADTLQYLLKYFLSPFKQQEYYNFTHSIELSLNEIYTIATRIFENTESFVTQSSNIAKHLYDNSLHPKVKGGELYVAYFRECILDDEVVEAVGIFKSEIKDIFLKISLNQTDDGYSIYHDSGINTNNLDKGCLIFNTDKEVGYKVCVIDNTNREEAQYWKQGFLEVVPFADNYHYTANYLNTTKKFITQHLQDDNITPIEKIDMLSDSIDFFKKREDFDETDFENTVFKDFNLINSFREYKVEIGQKNNIRLPENFSISPVAVKKQSKTFKSILKLDKNFQIHILNNEAEIERGVDENGKKYYKIYFDRES